MDSEKLYEELINKKELQDVPINYIVIVSKALLEIIYKIGE